MDKSMQSLALIVSRPLWPLDEDNSRGVIGFKGTHWGHSLIIKQLLSIVVNNNDNSIYLYSA